MGITGVIIWLIGVVSILTKSLQVKVKKGSTAPDTRIATWFPLRPGPQTRPTPNPTTPAAGLVGLSLELGAVNVTWKALTGWSSVIVAWGQVGFRVYVGCWHLSQQIGHMNLQQETEDFARCSDVCETLGFQP